MKIGGQFDDASKESVGYKTRKLVKGMPSDLEMLCKRWRSKRLKCLIEISEHWISTR